MRWYYEIYQGYTLGDHVFLPSADRTLIEVSRVTWDNEDDCHAAAVHRCNELGSHALFLVKLC